MAKKSTGTGHRLSAFGAHRKGQLRDAFANVLSAWPEGEPLTEPLDQMYLPEMARRLKALTKPLWAANLSGIRAWEPSNFSGKYARALLLAACHPTTPLEFLERTLHDANRNGQLSNVLLALAKFATDVWGLDGLLDNKKNLKKNPRVSRRVSGQRRAELHAFKEALEKGRANGLTQVEAGREYVEKRYPNIVDDVEILRKVQTLIKAKNRAEAQSAE